MPVSEQYRNTITRLKRKYRGKSLQRFGASFERWFAKKLTAEHGAFVIRHTRSQFPDLAVFYDGKSAFVECKTYPPDGPTKERLMDLCKTFKIPGYIAYLVRIGNARRGNGEVRALRVMRVWPPEGPGLPILDKLAGIG